ncbi:hypothetical protein VFPPC_07156 [Pochonia chlamydosporia 170]|uniref:Uncharacterized protein n=1 Tax=Pochonia chlamydosporia 170 TaxID=1380566 RepID=A0A179F9V7_METCM|nr:hypothetical protein VFPPC_07156 [Pochonia chlamydosporia 170]OAQ62187.2 hypothetical protein VFPPC_07156 [Pochonia chlamydosporia 170]
MNANQPYTCLFDSSCSSTMSSIRSSVRHIIDRNLHHSQQHALIGVGHFLDTAYSAKIEAWNIQSSPMKHSLAQHTHSATSARTTADNEWM